MKAKELRGILDNAAWNLPQSKWQEWARLALAALNEPKCQTCGDSGKKIIPPIISPSDFPRSVKFTSSLAPKTIPCPDCPKPERLTHTTLGPPHYGKAIPGESCPICQPKPEQPIGEFLAETAVFSRLKETIFQELAKNRSHTKRLKLLEAEKAKAELLIAFYLEGLEKSDEEIKQFEAEAKANLKMALKYHQQVDELTKRLGVDDPWHNVADTNCIEQLKKDLVKYGQHLCNCEIARQPFQSSVNSQWECTCGFEQAEKG